ncbi:MAG: hypothetical protein AMS21_09160, partial [Gemmatimonas sp. SG8_38_2]
ARGEVCWGDRCLPVRETTGYHDHNWGTWGGVVWDWGVAHAGDLDVLYGGVHGEFADEARRAGVRFLGYVVDSLGVAAVLEPREMLYSGEQLVSFQGELVPVPERLSWTAVGLGDSVTVAIDLEKVALSRLSLGGDADVFFAQMQGVMVVSGVIGGRGVAERGPGFFETYLRR